MKIKNTVKGIELGYTMNKGSVKLNHSKTMFKETQKSKTRVGSEIRANFSENTKSALTPKSMSSNNLLGSVQPKERRIEQNLNSGSVIDSKVSHTQS